MDDIYQPLMVWWGIETHCRTQPDEVIQLFEADRRLSKFEISKSTVLSRLMQRFATEGTRRDLQRCASLLAAVDQDVKPLLIDGFEAAFRGRPLPSLPDELTLQLARAGGGSLALRMRQRDEAALREALALIRNDGADTNQRIELIGIAGELRLQQLPALLLESAQLSETPESVLVASLDALQAFDDPSIAEWTVANYAKMPSGVQKRALELLSSRPSWVKTLIAGIDLEQIDPVGVPIGIVRKCLHTVRDGPIRDAIHDRWGKDIDGSSSAEMKAEVQRLSDLLNAQVGDVYAGQKLFRHNCGKCHKLFIDGGDIGPDLTYLQT